MHKLQIVNMAHKRKRNRFASDILIKQMLTNINGKLTIYYFDKYQRKEQ